MLGITSMLVIIKAFNLAKRFIKLARQLSGNTASLLLSSPPPSNLEIDLFP